MENNIFENKNSNEDQESKKFFEYKNLLDEISKEVSSLESDWDLVGKEGNKLPFSEKGIRLIEFLSSDKIADGPFIRNFYYDLMDFVEKEDSLNNHSVIRKLVEFNYTMRLVQGMVWKLRDEKDHLLELMEKYQESSGVSLTNDKNILEIRTFYLTMKNLSLYLKDMSNILNNVINSKKDGK